MTTTMATHTSAAFLLRFFTCERAGKEATADHNDVDGRRPAGEKSNFALSGKRRDDIDIRLDIDIDIDIDFERCKWPN